MEPFIDGGYIELLLVLLAGFAINFIFLKKHVLVIFSVISIASPVFLLFITGGAFYSWLVSLCIFNAAFLIILLWKIKIKDPVKPLFDLQKIFKNRERTDKEIIK
jgi:hypothetical protein